MKLILETWRKFLNEEIQDKYQIFLDMDGVLVDMTEGVVETVNTIPYVLDTTKVEVTVPTEKQSQSTVCGKPTSKNIPCKNKTKHESGSCHHHRD